MEKQKITSNDILELISIKINDTIRPNKKKDKKNNAYFWIFKCILLLIYIQIIICLLNGIKDLGILAIYDSAKSLRSILSGIWILSLNFIKGLLILYLLYSHFKIFTESQYFKNLYQSERKILKKKKKVVKIIDKVFKIFAILYLIVIGLFSTLSLFVFIYMISMLIDGTFIVSPILMVALIFSIFMLIFKHIQNKFFDTLPVVNRNYVLILSFAIVASICLFGYEIQSFKRDSSLPKGFEMIEKSQNFSLNDGQYVYIDSNSKLDNINLIEDDSLEKEIIIKLSYYRTAKISYVSEFNKYDDLKLRFENDIDLSELDISDISKLFVSTFNSRTIYNYNLFKYPNINIYANKEDFKRIKIS